MKTLTYISRLLAACRRRLARGTSATVVGCGFLLMSFGQSAFAVDYYWLFDIQTWLSRPFSDPSTACSAYTSESGARMTGVTPISVSRFRCSFTSGVNNSKGSYFVNRYGTSCPALHSYNSETGKCDPPPPECPVGDPSIFKGSTGAVVTVNGANYVNSEAPSSACYEQCSYTVNPRTQSCFLEKGSTNTGFCNYLGESTGENCSSPNTPLGQAGDQLNPPDTPNVPPSDPNDPGCPDGWSWSGTTCVRDTPPDPGEGDGGEDGEPGDGGGGGPGDGGGDGDGDGEGDGGGDGDGGNGGLPGDGDGEGDGTCDPSKDPSCAPGSVSGPGCDQPLVCTGDVVSCAILKQQKDMRCHAEEQAECSPRQRG